MIMHNGLFTECEVLDIFRGLCSPRTRTRTCKLVLEDPRRQGLSSTTTTQLILRTVVQHKAVTVIITIIIWLGGLLVERPTSVS